MFSVFLLFVHLARPTHLVEHVPPSLPTYLAPTVHASPHIHVILTFWLVCYPAKEDAAGELCPSYHSYHLNNIVCGTISVKSFMTPIFTTVI